MRYPNKRKEEQLSLGDSSYEASILRIQRQIEKIRRWVVTACISKSDTVGLHIQVLLTQTCKSHSTDERNERAPATQVLNYIF